MHIAMFLNNAILELKIYFHHIMSFDIFYIYVCDFEYIDIRMHWIMFLLLSL